jgi:hypothetical protein
MIRTLAPQYHDYTPLDGYDWMEQQTRSIHGPLQIFPEYGEWPYQVYVGGKRTREDKSIVWVVRYFSEHDVYTWVFHAEAEYKDFLETLQPAE